jgi:hypothetical protein
VSPKDVAAEAPLRATNATLAPAILIAKPILRIIFSLFVRFPYPARSSQVMGGVGNTEFWPAP